MASRPWTAGRQVASSSGGCHVARLLPIARRAYFSEECPGSMERRSIVPASALAALALVTGSLGMTVHQAFATGSPSSTLGKFGSQPPDGRQDAG